MNQEQIGALLRTVFQFLGGVAVGRGWIDGDTATALSGLAVTIGLTLWGIYVRRDKGLVESAAAVPEVAKIVATPDIARSVTNAKVVGPARF